MNINQNTYSGLVIGADPINIMKKYDSAQTVEPYVKYKKSSAKNLREGYIAAIDALLKNSASSLSPSHKDLLSYKLSHLQSISDDDYYAMITQGLTIDNNGDALSCENPNAKYSKYTIGGPNVIPLKLLNGEDSFSATIGDVDWDYMTSHLNPIYNLTWELCHGKTPVTESEKQIVANMQDKHDYFDQFSSKYDYVKYCSAYWTYAVITPTIWQDINESTDYKKWILDFYDNFINGLNKTEQITVVEFSL